MKINNYYGELYNAHNIIQLIKLLFMAVMIHDLI